MRYQDPPDAQDPAQDPRWRSLSDQTDARYRGSHQPAAGRQGLRPDQGQSGGQYPGQDQYPDQGQSGDQYPGQDQYPAQGRSGGQERYPAQGQSGGAGGSGSQYAAQGRPGGPGGSGGQGSSGSQYPAQGRPAGQGSSQDDLWTPRAPNRERYQDSRQAVFERPPPPAERHWDG